MLSTGDQLCQPVLTVWAKYRTAASLGCQAISLPEEAWLVPATSTGTTDVTPADRVLSQGWLGKKYFRVNRWSHRFFVLVKDKLIYYTAQVSRMTAVKRRTGRAR